VSSTQPVRIRLRFASFDALIDKFAPNVTRGGVFIASRTPLPIGSTFAFEIQLAGGEVALAGDGKVTWVKAFDPATPHKPHGMGVQFLRLDNPSRELLNKILARKAAAAAPGAAARAPMPMAGSGAYRIGTNGTAQPKVDTSVDLASEFGVDEARLRRAVDRNWLGANKVAGEVDELENLLKPEPVEPVSIAQALVELPRLLSENGAARVRRMSGAVRTVGGKPEDR
jgi:uncharacterized protein (TIGR02266 family)